MERSAITLMLEEALNKFLDGAPIQDTINEIIQATTPPIPDHPRATIDITPNRIEIHLSSWSGVSMTMIDRIYHELIKAIHINRAKEVESLRKGDSNVEKVVAA